MKIKVRKIQGCRTAEFKNYRKKKSPRQVGKGGVGIVFYPSPYRIELSKIDLFGDFACRTM